MRSLVAASAAAVLAFGVAACDQGPEEATAPADEELQQSPAPQEQIGEQPTQPPAAGEPMEEEQTPPPQTAD